MGSAGEHGSPGSQGLGSRCATPVAVAEGGSKTGEREREREREGGRDTETERREIHSTRTKREPGAMVEDSVASVAILVPQ